MEKLKKLTFLHFQIKLQVETHLLAPMHFWNTLYFAIIALSRSEYVMKHLLGVKYFSSISQVLLKQF
jgi:hypothetical protein